MAGLNVGDVGVQFPGPGGDGQVNAGQQRLGQAVDCRIGVAGGCAFAGAGAGDLVAGFLERGRLQRQRQPVAGLIVLLCRTRFVNSVVAKPDQNPLFEVLIYYFPGC